MKKLLLAALFLGAISTAAACDSCNTSVVVCAPAKTVVVSTPVCPPPAPKKVVAYVDKEYLVNEVHSETINELRTRNVTRKYDVVKEKIVTDTKIDKVKIPGANKPRLARSKQLRAKEYTVKENITTEEEYIQPVVKQTIVPTLRTYKVATIVDAE
jgi:hypothetical protein